MSFDHTTIRHLRISQFSTSPSSSPPRVKLELTFQGSGAERKRPRTEIDVEALVNHPSLYFDNGTNVILGMWQQKPSRVDRSLLSKHPPLFSELLDTNRNKKSLCGCMLLKVEDDQDDVEDHL